MSSSRLTVAALAVLAAIGIGAAVYEYRALALSMSRLASLEQNQAALRRQLREAETRLAKSERNQPTDRERLSTPSDDSRQLARAVAARTASRPVASDGADSRVRARLHARYDPFLRQRRLTPAQAERFIDLMIAEANLSDDFRAAVREQGLIDNAAVESVRNDLSQPISQGLLDLLGNDGVAAYGEFEQSSYYGAMVQPLSEYLLAANLPLASAQAEQLGAAVAAADHPVRLEPTDTRAVSRIDWEAVVTSAQRFLTAEQLTVLQARVQVLKQRQGTASAIP